MNKKRGLELVNLALGTCHNDLNTSTNRAVRDDNLETINPSPCPIIEGDPGEIAELLQLMDNTTTDCDIEDVVELDKLFESGMKQNMVKYTEVADTEIMQHQIVDPTEVVEPSITYQKAVEPVDVLEPGISNQDIKEPPEIVETEIMELQVVESTEVVEPRSIMDQNAVQPIEVVESGISNQVIVEPAEVIEPQIINQNIQDYFIVENVQLEEIAENITENESVTLLTKKGTIRKRKPKRRKEDIEELKKKKLLEKHILREAPCVTKNCKMKCIEKISEARRKEIHTQYVNMVWKEQQSFLLGHVSKENVKRHYTSEETRMRNMSIKYCLLNSNGNRENVCKTFFLTTLGYNEKNDSVIYKLISRTDQSCITIEDGRGKRPAVNKIDPKPIKQHIELFNPTISHYRREHAPNIRYLPSDISVKDMHDDFNAKHPELNVSYDFYRKELKNMRIRFTKLGHEECEQCEEFNLHNKDHTNKPQDFESCKSCTEYVEHIKRAKDSREAYRADADTNYTDTVCVSADLQKVIMLPRIDMFKVVIFTPRLIAYHESFVRVGTKQSNLNPHAFIWHEAISGRSKEDIISTYYNFLLHHRDTQKIIIWADNCTSQNKNWTFFSFLVYMVNSDEVATQEIQMKYFEPGHTFMSADTFHHSVEKSLKSSGKVYDFNDFEGAIGKANSGKVTIKKMEHSDFFHWKDYSSSYKISNKKVNAERPYISNMVTVRAERGNNNLKYRISYAGEEKEMNFLKKSALVGIPKPVPKTEPAGIEKSRKTNLIQKLGRLMQPNRMLFWQNLPTCAE